MQNPEEPHRYWILNPLRHSDPLTGEDKSPVCGECFMSLNFGSVTNPNPIPVKDGQLLCPTCVAPAIKDHPVTVEYLEKLDEGSHEWWSPWLCGCPGCKDELEKMQKGENGWKLLFHKPSLPTQRSV